MLNQFCSKNKVIPVAKWYFSLSVFSGENIYFLFFTKPKISISPVLQKNKHDCVVPPRAIMQKDEAILRQLLQQELKKRESLGAAEGKVAKLREQLLASEKVVSANLTLLKKLQEQVGEESQGPDAWPGAQPRVQPWFGAWITLSVPCPLAVPHYSFMHCNTFLRHLFMLQNEIPIYRHAVAFPRSYQQCSALPLCWATVFTVGLSQSLNAQPFRPLGAAC